MDEPTLPELANQAIARLMRLARDALASGELETASRCLRAAANVATSDAGVRDAAADMALHPKP